MTTEAMVAEKPKKETPAMPGMPPGGRHGLLKCVKKLGGPDDVSRPFFYAERPYIETVTESRGSLVSLI